MEKIMANPKMMLVDSTRGIERMSMAAHYRHSEAEDQQNHAEDKQGRQSKAERSEHADEKDNLDPHIWLSPKLVKAQARNIHDALIQLDAKHQAEYQANLKSFLSDIDALDADIRTTLPGVKSRKFMVFHPAWGYFARDYELEMLPIEVGGQEPSAAELAKLITQAKAEGIKVVFAQPEFSARTANTIAREIGGEVLLISPLAPDWLSNLRQVAKIFAEVLSQ
jgi:zinc transport system substrate-binding protein